MHIYICTTISRIVAVKKLLKVAHQSLHVIETVDSLSLATTLDKSLQSIDPNRSLNVFVQVNTSGEDGESIFSSVLRFH